MSQQEDNLYLVASVETDEGTTLRIDTDRFNFSCHRAFRESYKHLPVNSNIKVDFKKVSYMDSSALGMLLLLREHNGQNRENIQFVNCSESIQNIFKVANFSKIFVI